MVIMDNQVADGRNQSMVNANIQLELYCFEENPLLNLNRLQLRP